MPILDRYDISVVGSGPAGLTSAFTAESEGERTLVLEQALKYGGQAGESTLIENYGGFVNGVIGRDLVSSFVDQARKFGAELLGSRRVVDLERRAPNTLALIDDEGNSYLSTAVILSPGAQYRRLDAEGIDGLLGRGVYYNSPTPTATFKGKKIYIVGTGNSAGQAANHLIQNCEECEVHLLARGSELSSSMSPYLTKRLSKADGVTVHTKTEVVRADGVGHLEGLTLRQDGEEVKVPADELFILIGADPKVHWLSSQVELDDHNFIHTGESISNDARSAFIEANGRQPFAYETSQAGVFAVGDIRSGSTKRVASAHGQGAVVVSQIKAYIESLHQDPSAT